MFHYKVKISYKGTRYFGWQTQPEVDKPTVQETIEKILAKIVKYQKCKVVGASRTDAGVHAQGQVGKISIPADIDSRDLLRGMNSLLPKDIRIMECDICEETFNPIKDSTSKEYHYYFSTDSIEGPFQNETVTNVSGPLNLASMNKAAKHFIGERDFYNFSRRDSNASTTIRTITHCEILQARQTSEHPVFYIRLVGNGFLKQMARYMASALFKVGRGEIDPSVIRELLLTRAEEKLASKSKPQGLHLIAVNY